MEYLKKYIYHTVLILAIILPGLLWQDFYPLVDQALLDDVKYFIYKTSLTFRKPETLARKSQNGNAQAINLFLNQNVREDLKKIRNIYNALSSIGSPPVILTLQDPQYNVRGYKNLIRMVNSYKNLIHSGFDYELSHDSKSWKVMKFEPGLRRSILSDSNEIETKVSGLTLNNRALLRNQISYVGLNLAAGILENSRFKENCLRMYHYDDVNQNLILNPMIWALLFNKKWDLETINDFSWPGLNDKTPFTFKGKLKISEIACSSYPKIPSDKYADERRLHANSYEQFVKLFEKKNKNSFKRMYKDKIIYLNLFNSENKNDSNITLFLRLSDEIHIGKAILDVTARSPYFDIFIMVSCLVMSLVLLVFFNIVQLFLFVTTFLISVNIYNIIRLTYYNSYQILTLTTLYLMTTFVIIFFIYLLLVLLKKRQLGKFQQELETNVKFCRTLEDLKMGVQRVCSARFSHFKIYFLGYNQKLYSLADPLELDSDMLDSVSLYKEEGQSLYTLVRQNPESTIDDQEALTGARSSFDRPQVFDTVITNVKKSGKKFNSPLDDRFVSIKLSVTYHQEILGNIDIQLAYHPYEELMISEMLHVIQSNLSDHWYRIHLFTIEKINEFKMVLRMGRLQGSAPFLNKLNQNKLIRKNNFSQGLQEVFEVVTSKTAILQVKVFGFHNAPTNVQNIHVASLIQKFYSRVLDLTLNWGQPKLYGDKIQFFIEDSLRLKDDITFADLSLFISCKIIALVKKINEELKSPNYLSVLGTNHYAKMVKGNLATKDYIDYTLVGSHVNMVNQLEDLCSIKPIVAMTGSNAVCLSEQLLENLNYFKSFDIQELNLEELGYKVRNYPDIRKVYYISEEIVDSISEKIEFSDLI